MRGQQLFSGGLCMHIVDKHLVCYCTLMREQYVRKAAAGLFSRHSDQFLTVLPVETANISK